MHLAPVATTATATNPANIASDAPSSAPLERFGIEWPTQIADTQRRHFSVPPALDSGSLILRERLPYPARTMTELTTLMTPPIFEPRSYASEPITEDERRALRVHNVNNDWHRIRENRPQQTPWVGYDHGYFANYGYREAPNETAAVPNDDVMQSIEPEGDPLVALRQARDQNLTTNRRDLERRIELEDRNAELEGRVETLEHDYTTLRGTHDSTVNTLAEIRSERNRAQREIRRLRLDLNMPEEAHRQRQAQQDQYEDTRLREVALARQVRTLQRSEADLKNRLQAETTTATGLREKLEDVEYHSQGFREAQVHWETATNRERARNQNLQGQVQALTNQLAAAQAALANPPPVVQPLPVNVAPNVAPLAAQPPAAAHPVGPVRGRGRERARGRAGRGRGGAAPVVRDQPGRSCKVRKNYKS